MTKRKSVDTLGIRASIQPEHFHITIPDDLRIVQSISLRKVLAAIGVALDARRHAIVAMPQFMQKDVNQLKCPRRLIRKPAQILLTLFLANDPETIEHSQMVTKIRRTHVAPEFALPSADGDDPITVPAVAPRIPFVEHDGVQPLGQIVPVGQDADEVDQLALGQQVAKTLPRSAPIDDRNVLRRIEIVRRFSRPILPLNLTPPTTFGVVLRPVRFMRDTPLDVMDRVCSNRTKASSDKSPTGQ